MTTEKIEKVYLVRNDPMYGGGMIKSAYSTMDLAVKKAKGILPPGQSQDNAMHTVREVACEDMGDGRVIVDGMVHQLDLVESKSDIKKRALAKLNKEETESLGLVFKSIVP